MASTKAYTVLVHTSHDVSMCGARAQCAPRTTAVRKKGPIRTSKARSGRRNLENSVSNEASEMRVVRGVRQVEHQLVAMPQPQVGHHVRIEPFLRDALLAYVILRTDVKGRATSSRCIRKPSNRDGERA